MRCAVLISAFCLLYPLAASAALLEPSQVDASGLLPPPPVAGSVEEKAEFEELRAIAARSTPEMRAIAKHDAEDETPDIFNAAIGFDIAATPATFKLLKMVVDEEDGDTKGAKAFFHRERPYATDPSLKTCTPVKPGSDTPVGDAVTLSLHAAVASGVSTRKPAPTSTAACSRARRLR